MLDPYELMSEVVISLHPENPPTNRWERIFCRTPCSLKPPPSPVLLLLLLLSQSPPKVRHPPRKIS